MLDFLAFQQANLVTLLGTLLQSVLVVSMSLHLLSDQIH